MPAMLPIFERRMNFNWMEEEGGPQERLGVDHLVESLLGWAFQQVTCPSHCNDPQVTIHKIRIV